MKTSLFAVLACLVLIGCASSGDGLSEKDQTAATRLEQIAKSSGGDWAKVSDQDKKYLVDEVAMGNEQSAKMLLLSKSDKLRAAPGPKK